MKIEDITAKLEQGIDELLNGGDWQRYLDTMSRFHHYSFGNIILIVMQCPTASRVAGFQTWKKMGRYVKKGEKAIQIIAPCPHKKKIMDGDEEKEIVWNTYKGVSVFDVSQTDGEPLPEICRDLTAAVDQYEEKLEKLKAFAPVQVVFEDIHGGSHGYYSKKEEKIAVKTGMAQAQTIKTLVHEIAHSLLHNDSEETSQVKEVEAESIAYTVCQYLGIDSGTYSFGYVAGWAGGDKEKLKKSLDNIQKTAHKIISIF